MIALYSRVSTAEQAREGYSIGEQEDRMIKYCESMGWGNYKTYTDGGYSGGNINRPALQELIQDVKSGKVSRVIVYKLDRLSRSQKDTLELIEDVFLASNADFISISENFDTSTPLGKAMIGIMACFAQLEREQIRERVTTGREARNKVGKWHGSGLQPIGYDYINGELVVNEYEAMQVREVYNLYLQGYTYTEITVLLNDKGYNSKHGVWKLTRVINVLKNPLYIGMVKFGDVFNKGIHEPIIDEDTYNRVAAKIAKSSRSKPNSRRPIQEAYLIGMLRCAKCGLKLTHNPSRSGRTCTKWLHYYTCTGRMRGKQLGRERCTNKRYRCDKLDQMIIDEIKKLTIDEIQEQRAPDNSKALKREVKKLEAQRSRLIDLYALGRFDTKELTSRIDTLDIQITKLQEQLAPRISPEITTAINTIPDVIEHGEPIQIRHLITTLIDHIDIDDDDITIYWRFS